MDNVPIFRTAWLVRDQRRRLGQNPYCLRAAYKHGNPSDTGLDMVGFRCAADESGRVRR